MKKFVILGLVLVLVVAAAVVYSLGLDQGKQATLEPVKAKAKMVDFINNNLMQRGSQVSINEFSQEKGLYKAVVNIPQNQGADATTTSYMTLDGSQFFPQAYDVAEIEQKRKAQEQASRSGQQQQPSQDIPKQETPEVELFVMSHCPYGTQMEKGMLPVWEKLGDKADFKLKFCDYAMHGEKEVNEQMNQYCIQKNQPEKLTAYLECFLAKEDNSDKCLDETGIDRGQLESCVSEVDAEYKITEKLNDKSTWKSGRFPVFPIYEEETQAYGISGSPGLVVNGTKVNSGRSPQALLSTVCSGFENPPQECEAELSSSNPSAGFGFGGTGASGGSCN